MGSCEQVAVFGSTSTTDTSANNSRTADTDIKQNILSATPGTDGINHAI
jgi:hypothetical protein